MHSGPSGTYVQKRSGALTRIDYIACPESWRAGNVSTWTDPEVHTGQTYVDHIATLVSVRATVCLGAAKGHCTRHRFDSRAMLTPEGRRKVTSILEKAPAIPWEATPHAHFGCLHTALLNRGVSLQCQTAVSELLGGVHLGAAPHCCQIAEILPAPASGASFPLSCCRLSGVATAGFWHFGQHALLQVDPRGPASWRGTEQPFSPNCATTQSCVQARQSSASYASC